MDAADAVQMGQWRIEEQRAGAAIVAGIQEEATQ
jgi:hypothetical protein